ncbi:hypothetical protein GUJ93_ZPchr0013g35644 [Zizania palustris]|uniref:X8 domain-containing protein n=1 Tax=Zizania palustris TaxID=103762 RepID=A0A8J6C3D9_ZIZPA|nr:hypothetical protein GUJ93_ZPchr0013g35644 [Zizania palustris]
MLVPAKDVQYMSRTWCAINTNAQDTSKLADNINFACTFADCTTLGYDSTCVVWTLMATPPMPSTPTSRCRTRKTRPATSRGSPCRRRQTPPPQPAASPSRWPPPRLVIGGAPARSRCASTASGLAPVVLVALVGSTVYTCF